MNWHRPYKAAVCAILACLALIGCGDGASKEKRTQRSDDSPHSAALTHFKLQNPELEVIKWAEADLNNDGRKDCVIMYRVGSEKNMMRVVLDLVSGQFDTNEVPAPISDQVIQFRDIDRKPPLEFIVQGAKGAKVGFAVFRIKDNRLVDLFGEGMEDCC